MGWGNYDHERGRRAESYFEKVYLLVGIIAFSSVGLVAIDYADGYGDIFKDATVIPSVPEGGERVVSNTYAVLVAVVCAVFDGYALARLRKI